ncbi:cell division protein FtsY [Agaribacterium haliotis]|uniref:cell division protein FtsY n=1 Tax=Agaribacterium haliotis TaxID=2013869 RepID=UPI000BB5940D|nr:cell division protein FtsY [Agaribacterium haliotis]
MKTISFFSAIFVMLLAAPTLAQENDEVISLSATVTGNKEQPKVLYIVPWKQTEDNRILEHGLRSYLGDVFDHVEPQEHRREINYLEKLAIGDKEQSSK